MSLPHLSAFQRILRWHAKAREYMLDDPEVALMIARKTGEAVCKIIFYDKNGKSNIPTGLDVLIQQLNKTADLPKKLNLHLLNIQQHGNFGSHDQGDESDEIDAEFVAHCITSLDYVCKWLQYDYLDAGYRAALTPPTTTTTPRPAKFVSVTPPITVKSLAAAMNFKPFVLIKDLMDIGVFANQNQHLDPDVAVIICEIHGYRFDRESTNSR